MATRHHKIVATVILGPKNVVYRTAIVKRSERPDQFTWVEALRAFSIDHPDDWNKYSYGDVKQARRSFGGRVKALGTGADVDPDIVRVTVKVPERSVRMD